MEPERGGWVEGGVGHWYLTQHGQYTLMFFLPEVHSDKGNEADWGKAWEGQVALLFSRGFTPSSLEVKHVVNGTCLPAKAQFHNHVFFFFNQHRRTNQCHREEEFSRKKKC